MARIPGFPATEAVEEVRLAYRYTREGLAQVTGRQPDRMLDPFEMYAYAPGLLSGSGSLDQATAALNRVDIRLKYLAQLKAATVINCEYCIDLGSQVLRRSGLSDEQLLALPNFRTSPLFSDLEKLVLDYAVGMSLTPVEVP